MGGFEEMTKSEFELAFLHAANEADAHDSQRHHNHGDEPTDRDLARAQVLAPTATIPARNRDVQTRTSERRKHKRVVASQAVGLSLPSATKASLTLSPERAVTYADDCRRLGLSLQRQYPPDLAGAGALLHRACDTRARAGLFCTQSNAESHTEYARNLSQRGLTSQAEYHLRTAGDIWRLLDLGTGRKYADVLLYTAVVIDRQGRYREAETYYRASLAVYRMNKLSDNNVNFAIEQLAHNLKFQGRRVDHDELVKDHFFGRPGSQ